jgi:hypothetical protein
MAFSLRLGLGTLTVTAVLALAAIGAEAAVSASSPDPDRLLLIEPAFATGDDWRGSHHPATAELPAEVGWGNRAGVVVNVTVQRYGWELPTRLLSPGLGVPPGGRDADGHDVRALRPARLRAAAPSADDVTGVATACSATDRCRRYDFALRYRGTLLRVVAFNARQPEAELEEVDALRFLHDLDVGIGG